MAAGGAKQEIIAKLYTDEEFGEELDKPGLLVVDTYAKWAGPCLPMQNIFRRIKFDLGDSIRIAQAQTDTIEQLARYRGRSIPTFLFYIGVDLVKVIRGANSPLIEATIKEQLELEKMGVERQPYFENGDDVKPSPAAQLPEPDEDVSEPVPLSKLKTRSQVALSYAGSMALADIAEGDTLAIIKPDCGPRMVKAIKDHIKAGQFKVVKEKRVWFTKERAEEFYQEHKEKAFFDDLIRFMTSAPCIALHLHKENAVLDWRTMIGPTNSDIARDTAPNSIRAFAGTDGTRNAVHGSDSIAASDRELELIFGAGPELRDLPNVPYPVRRRPDVPPSASEVTLVLVKPDAVAAGKDGEILDVVRARGYDVLQQEKVEISADRARELYREHAQKPFFADLIAHLTSGPVIVAAVKGDDCVHGWREMIGPTDPAEAKIHRPMSIRARYGTDTMRNAVHGSDSPDSAYRELDLIFPDIVKSENIPPPPPNLEYTLALIKPDAMAKGYKDAIIQRIEDAGFNILQEKEVTQPIELAKAFYIEHAGKAFFDDLTTWMSSAPIHAMILEKENAIEEWRKLAGPTDSNNARAVAPQSIRALYGEDKSHNAVHGSDSRASAAREITVMFGKDALGPPGVEPSTVVDRTIERPASILNLVPDVPPEEKLRRSSINVAMPLPADREADERPLAQTRSKSRMSARGLTASQGFLARHKEEAEEDEHRSGLTSPPEAEEEIQAAQQPLPPADETQRVAADAVVAPPADPPAMLQPAINDPPETQAILRDPPATKAIPGDLPETPAIPGDPPETQGVQGESAGPKRDAGFAQ